MKNTRSAIFKRQNLILQKLNSNGSILIEEIARELHVSPLTVRRDIDEFVQKGLAQRFFGGASLVNRPLRADQGFRIITPAILYRGNLLVCCTGVAYGEAAFSLLLRYPKSQPV